jgi:quercetin dioxygenase-like cupin family protein
MRIVRILFLTIVFVTALVVAQSGHPSASPIHGSVQEPFIKTAQENTFATSPVLPDCYTYTVERGDPKTGPSVTLSRLAAGCKVPWHTHSANAQVLFVSGTFQLTMRGQQAQTLSQGSYAYVPAKHQHQERCLDGCTYYVIREGAADVHYVDARGKEISAEAALAAVAERPAAAESRR